MADTIEFDLAALEQVFERVPNLVANRIDGLVFEVTIGAEVRAAILADKNGVFARCLIVPRDARTARAITAD
jgi:hypothetical protein